MRRLRDARANCQGVLLAMARTIQIYVNNRDGHPLTGARIELWQGDDLIATIKDSRGQGSFNNAPLGPVQVVASYKDKQGRATLAAKQDHFTLVLDVQGDKTGAADLVALGVGIAAIVVALILGFSVPTPSPLQLQLIRGVFALGLAAAGTILPGRLGVELKLGQRLAITAAGALGLFVVAWFFIPAGN